MFVTHIQSIQVKLRRSFTNILKRSLGDLKHVAVQQKGSKTIHSVHEGSQKFSKQLGTTKTIFQTSLGVHDTVANNL